LKVKEFCRVLDLDECNVSEIRVRYFHNGRVEFETMTDAQMNYTAEEYDTLGQWFEGKYRNMEVMEGVCILSRTMFIDLREEKNETL